MRILILILILAGGSAFGQTLKWTYTQPHPNVQFTNVGTTDIVLDTLGNFAFTSEFFNGGNFAAGQIVWGSATGKQIHVDVETDPSVRFSRVLLVSANTLLLELFVDDSLRLRKYVKRGATVTFTEMELGGNYIQGLPPVGPKNDFYTMSDTVWPKLVRRYSLK